MNDSIINKREMLEYQREEDIPEEELVAILTAAICASTGIAESDLMIRKIRRVNSSMSPWQQITVPLQMTSWR